MEIYVHNGKVCKDKPPEGTYAGVANLPVSDVLLLQFFSECLSYYSFCKSDLEKDDSESYLLSLRCVYVFEALSERAGVSHLFKSFYNQVKEIENGKKS